MSSSTDTVLYTHHNKHLTEIILNSPKSLNSLDLPMIKSLLKVTRRWLPENDSSEKKEKSSEEIPKAVIISGAGEKAFCAGGDIVSIYNNKKNGNPLSDSTDFFKYEYLTDFTIARMKPVQIAFWKGVVMGGGVGVSINSPIRIATDNTLFAMPETKIGLVPDVGGTYFLPRIFNKNISVGLFIGLTGERLKGKDLAKCGLATHYASLEKFEILKKKIIETTNENSNYETIFKICSENSDFTYSESEFSIARLELINKIFLPDSLQDCIKRLKETSENGSEEDKKWATGILKNVYSYSPISMYLSFETIKRGISMRSLEEAYDLEFKLVSKILAETEFYEGIRALLIDKDMKPNWKYKSIDEINEQELINEYFSKV